MEMSADTQAKHQIRSRYPFPFFALASVVRLAIIVVIVVSLLHTISIRYFSTISTSTISVSVTADLNIVLGGRFFRRYVRRWIRETVFYSVYRV